MRDYASWLWSFQFHIINSERSFASSYSMNHQSAIGVALFFFKLWILPTYAKRGADYPISCLDSSKSNFGRWVSIGKCNFFTTVHNVYSINSEILWECCARRCSRKINQMKFGNSDLYERYQSVSINFMPSAHTIFQLHFSWGNTEWSLKWL